MCEIIVLFEGYSTQIDSETMDANCSCTLIKTSDLNIIVDTMTAWDKEEIVKALAKHNIRPEDINYVICSHSHADHIGNNNLFLEAKEHIVGLTVHRNTLFYERNLKDEDYKICDGVVITATPGHTPEDITVLATGQFNGKECTVAITGDLFEKEEDISDPSIWMNIGLADLRDTQAQSRAKIANRANVIIPGHGPPFYVTDEIRNQLSKQMEAFKSKQELIS